MCCVVSGKIAAAGSQAICHYTQRDVYTPVSLSLTIPTPATSVHKTSPPPSCFLVWVRGYCPFFSFGGTKHLYWTSFFEFWLQGYFGLTLPITKTEGRGGACGFATLTKYLATNVEGPKSRGTRLPAVIF